MITFNTFNTSIITCENEFDFKSLYLCYLCVHSPYIWHRRASSLTEKTSGVYHRLEKQLTNYLYKSIIHCVTLCRPWWAFRAASVFAFAVHNSMHVVSVDFVNVGTWWWAPWYCFHKPWSMCWRRVVCVVFNTDYIAYIVMLTVLTQGLYRTATKDYNVVATENEHLCMALYEHHSSCKLSMHTHIYMYMYLLHRFYTAVLK